MRDAGLLFHSYTEQITLLLFLKMADERTGAGGAMRGTFSRAEEAALIDAAPDITLEPFRKS